MATGSTGKYPKFPLKKKRNKKSIKLSPEENDKINKLEIVLNLREVARDWQMAN